MEHPFNQDEYYRYSRQFAVQDIGVQGQARLKKACIVIVGMGGIGCPAALYAASAGLGQLILIDPDFVTLSNLHRQILYNTADLGQLKVSVAAAKLKALNPHVQIEVHPTTFQAELHAPLLKRADLVIDGTDNYASRYQINSACILAHKPLVSASVYSWSGQIGFFTPPSGPCYACVFPHPPAEGLIPNCQLAGTLGVVTGMIALQAVNESLKYLLGLPVYPNRLMVYDAKLAQLKHYPIQQKPDCPVCLGQALGENFMSQQPNTSQQVPSIDCASFHAMKAQAKPYVLIDVREPWEREICKIEGSLAIPLGQLESQLKLLNPQDHFVIHCRSGGRSATATKLLQNHGYAHVKNLEGGILAWIDQFDPKQTKY